MKRGLSVWITVIGVVFLISVPNLVASLRNLTREEILEIQGQPFRTVAEEKKEDDSHFIQILKKFQEIVDGWLKSLNERIDNEDITGLEVRFLEILRNVLEWVKEKIDSQIEAARKEKDRREKGIFRETTFRSVYRVA